MQLMNGVRFYLYLFISFFIVSRAYKKKQHVIAFSVNVDLLLHDIGTEIDIKYGNDSSASEKDVMHSIKQAFDPKKLKEVENMEAPLEQYLESPNEVTFFNNLIKSFCHQVRNLVSHSFKKHYQD